MKKKILIVCLAALSGLGATAQQRNVELTLDKAVEIALNENPLIQIANLEIERQDYVRKETIGNLLPTVSANATYTRNILKQKMGGKIAMQGNNSYATAASLSLPLYAPGVYNTLKMNKEQMLAAVETARGSKISLVNEVKVAYYNTLLAQQSLSVLRESEKTLKKTVEVITASLNNGAASEYDQLTAQVQLSNLQPNLIQTQKSIEVAKLMLKMLLSLPEDVDITLDGQLDLFVEQFIASGDVMTTDITNNSDIRSLELQEKVLGAQFKTMRTQRMPTLGLFSSFNISGDESNFGAITGDTSGPKMIWQKPLGVGLKLNVPIFAGFTNINREKQLKNNIEQLRKQRDYAKQGKEVELKSAISDLLTAREQRDANYKTIQQATKAYSIASTRFQAGAGTILELNNAELAVTQAKLNYTQSSFNYLSAQASYDMIVGSDAVIVN